MANTPYASLADLSYVLDAMNVTQFGQDGSQDATSPQKQQFLLNVHGNNVESKLTMFTLPILDASTGSPPMFLTYIVCILTAASLAGRKLELIPSLENERMNCLKALDEFQSFNRNFPNTTRSDFPYVVSSNDLWGKSMADGIPYFSALISQTAYSAGYGGDLGKNMGYQTPVANNPT